MLYIVIRVWDLEDIGEGNFNSRLHLTLLESTDFFDIVFNPDGQRLIASTREGTTIGWEISQDEAQKSFTLSGHTSTVSRLAISPNGTRLATASYDGTAKIWDLATQQPLLTLFTNANHFTQIAFSPDGKRLATGTWEGTIERHALDLDDLIDLAYSRVTRAMSEKECQHYLPGEPGATLTAVN